MAAAAEARVEAELEEVMSEEAAMSEEAVKSEEVAEMVALGAGPPASGMSA